MAHLVAVEEAMAALHRTAWEDTNMLIQAATSKQSKGHAKHALVLLDEVVELLWMAEPSGVADDADYWYWAEQVTVALVHPAPHILYAD